MSFDGPRIERGRDYVLDLETQEWTRYVLGGLYDGHDFEAFDWRREDALLDKLRSLPKGTQVWTWNGGKFDGVWLADRLWKLGAEITVQFAGSAMTRLDIKGGASLRDGCRLYPTSLQAAARLAGIEMSKDVGLPNGYDDIRVGMPPGQLRALTEYLREDCIGTWNAIETMLGMFDAEGFTVRGTIGGTAWATARDVCGVDKASWRLSSEYKQAREGYYGGRVQVFRPRAERGHRYDIHSAYPAALERLELPVGPYRCVGSRTASKHYASGKEGIYQATVTVPESFVPPLPLRIGDHLGYPFGEFTGSWSALELRYAESCGTRIERVHAAMVWDKTERVLAPYQRKVWALKRAAKERGDTAAEKLWKFAANSLTGKLAQRPEMEQIIINPAIEDIKLCPGTGRCRGGCSGSCNGWRLKGPANIWGRMSWRIASCGHVQWGAYLTSATRVQLHAQVNAGPDDAVYCDTDSCYALGERTLDVGSELGQWGYDGGFEPPPPGDPCHGEPGYVAVAPKSYTYYDGSKHHVAAKGMPRASAMQLRGMARGEDIAVTDDRGILPMKSAMRNVAKSGGSLMQRKVLTRRSHADFVHYGDRIAARDGTTRAQHVRALAAQWRVER